MLVLASVSHSAVFLFAIPWTVACQAPLSMGFSRQESWSGLPCPSPGDLPNPGVEPMSLWSHGLQYTRLPCPSPTPGACSNSCPSRRWCHQTISFSSCLQSFPASGSFPVSQFFASGGQSIGASASVSVLPMNIVDWLLNSSSFRTDWFDLLAVQGTLKE